MHMTEVTICYGMTETSPVSTRSAPTTPLEKRVSTVGRVHPHVEVKIVDPDDRARSCPAARRASSAPAATASCSATGTTRTRRARRSTRRAGCTPATSRRWTTQGYVNIVGRIKDMVIRGGENIYPREVEEFLYTTRRHGRPGHRRARREVRRGADGLGQAPPGRRRSTGDEIRDVLQGQDRPLQDPALLQVRGRVPDDGHRQDPEVQDARELDRRARAREGRARSRRRSAGTWHAARRRVSTVGCPRTARTSALGSLPAQTRSSGAGAARMAGRSRPGLARSHSGASAAPRPPLPIA